MIRDALVLKELICLPSCEICHGIGYVRNEKPPGHPDFGKVEYCPRVDRWSLPGADKYGLTRDEITGLDWNSLAVRDFVEPAIEAIEKTIARGHGWVFIYGTFGAAKSYLLKIAIAKLLRAGAEAAYIRMPSLLSNVAAAFDDKHDGKRISEQHKLDWWAEIPFLAIDEIGRIRGTQFVLEQTFTLMDRRYENAIRERGITIMAANRAPDSLLSDGIDDGYLLDRIEDGRFQVIEIEGPGFRRTMGNTPTEIRLQELKQMSYADYLKTPEWKTRREFFLEQAERRCQVCNTEETIKQLNVHHRNYKRLGQEFPTDCIVLCETCHGLFHSQGQLAES